MCGGGKGDYDDNTQFEAQELPGDWQESIKKGDYKGDDYHVSKSFKEKKLVDQRRKCTDVLCLFIFVGFVGLMVFFSIWGYMNGKLAQLLAPVDGNARMCGFDEGVKDYPHLWIADLNKATDNASDMFLYGVCSKECPTAVSEVVSCVNTDYVTNCALPINSYPAYDMLNYCIPMFDDLTDAQQAGWDDMMNTFSTSFFGGWAVDLLKAKWVILSSIGICVVITLIYIVAMHWLAAILAWISVALVQIGLVLIGFFFWYQRNDLIENGSVAEQGMMGTAGLMWSMIIAWSAAGIMYLFLACNWNSLRVSVQVIKITADWVADTKRLFFMPLFFFLIGICFFALWITGLACVASMSSEDIKADGPGEQTKTLNWSASTTTMVYLMCFGAVWLMCFLTSFNEYVTIVAAISWYFSDKTIPDDDGIPGDSEVMLGFHWGFCYQMGSIAAGSLLLAVVWIISTIMKFIAKRMENASGENCCVKCVIGCLMCVVDCFHRFISYLTQNAYIQMALQNESFCQASVHAFLLILKNAAKFSMVSGISSVFMFIAKVAISVSTTWIGFILMGSMIPVGESFSQPLVPVLVIFFISYMIASIFIGVFDSGCNTILQCYLLDKEMGGNDDEPHVPEGLKKFLDDHKTGPEEPLLEKGNDMT